MYILLYIVARIVAAQLLPRNSELKTIPTNTAEISSTSNREPCAATQVQTLKNALAAAKSASEASRLITAAEAGMAVAVASENRERANPVAGDAVSSQDRVTTGGDGAEAEAEAEAAVRAAKELAAAQRELENVREREKDARDEANRTAEELERFR